MAHYRSQNKPDVQRVRVKIVRPLPVPKSRSTITPPQRPRIQSTQKPKRAGFQRNRAEPVSRVHAPYAPKTEKILSHQKASVKYFRPTKLIKKKTESRLHASHSKSLEAYRAPIMALHGSGHGKILVMVACGPSVLEVQLEKLKGVPNVDIMCINKPDKRVWPTKFWAFCDQSQYERNKDYWNNYGGIVVNASSVRVRHDKQVLIKNLPAKGFSRDIAKGYHIGRSSTYANLQVAMWMGYDKVYVFGLDMCAVGGKMHHYGKNPDVTDEQRLDRFKRESENYLNAAREILTPAEREKIVLCSNYNPWEFTSFFPKLDHLKAVDEIIAAAKIQ